MHGGYMARTIVMDASSSRESDDSNPQRISARAALDELRRSLEPQHPLRHKDGWSRKRLRRLIEALESKNPLL
jgi:hypothetical protein